MKNSYKSKIDFSPTYNYVDVVHRFRTYEEATEFDDFVEFVLSTLDDANENNESDIMFRIQKKFLHFKNVVNDMRQDLIAHKDNLEIEDFKNVKQNHVVETDIGDIEIEL